MSEETDQNTQKSQPKQPTEETQKVIQATAEKISEKLLLETRVDPEKSLGVALEILNEKIPMEVVFTALDMTMPKGWKENKQLSEMLKNMDPEEYRAVLALAACYWNLGFVKGFYSASMSNSNKGK